MTLDIFTRTTLHGPSDKSGPHAVRAPKAAELVARELRRMIIDGALSAPEKLPTPAHLCSHFGVSIPTIREAVRILESEGLVDSRSGARIGIRICSPGAETVARPASLLLALQKATIADVLTACVTVEVAAVRMIAENYTHLELDPLHTMLDSNWRPAYESGDFPTALFDFHRTLVHTSCSPTLSLLANTLYELLAPPAVHNWASLTDDPPAAKSYYEWVHNGSTELLTALATTTPDAVAELWTDYLKSQWAILFLQHSPVRLVATW